MVIFQISVEMQGIINFNDARTFSLLHLPLLLETCLLVLHLTYCAWKAFVCQPAQWSEIHFSRLVMILMEDTACAPNKKK